MVKALAVRVCAVFGPHIIDVKDSKADSTRVDEVKELRSLSAAGRFPEEMDILLNKMAKFCFCRDFGRS